MFSIMQLLTLAAVAVVLFFIGLGLLCAGSVVWGLFVLVGIPLCFWLGMPTNGAR